MPRDPDMRSGLILEAEIAFRIKGCDSRWVNGELDLKAAYEQRLTIQDILDGKMIHLFTGSTATMPEELLDAGEIIYAILDPVMVGTKVFRLLLADIAETNLAEFEESEFNSPEPRAMVDAVRAFAFGTTTARDVELKSDAAYEGENSRSNVYLYGRMAICDYTNWKELNDWQGLQFEELYRKKSLEELLNIIARMKEYDVGTVDLSDEVSVRPPRR